MAKSLLKVDDIELVYTYTSLVIGERAEEAFEAISGSKTLDVGQALWEICEHVYLLIGTVTC